MSEKAKGSVEPDLHHAARRGVAITVGTGFLIYWAVALGLCLWTLIR